MIVLFILISIFSFGQCKPHNQSLSVTTITTTALPVPLDESSRISPVHMNWKLLTVTFDIKMFQLKLSWSDETSKSVKLIQNSETESDCSYVGSYIEDPER